MSLNKPGARLDCLLLGVVIVATLLLLAAGLVAFVWWR